MASNQLKCMDCPYFWKEENESHGGCHYQWNDGFAPCDVEEREAEEAYW